MTNFRPGYRSSWWRSTPLICIASEKTLKRQRDEYLEWLADRRGFSKDEAYSHALAHLSDRQAPVIGLQPQGNFREETWYEGYLIRTVRCASVTGRTVWGMWPRWGDATSEIDADGRRKFIDDLDWRWHKLPKPDAPTTYTVLRNGCYRNSFLTMSAAKAWCKEHSTMRIDLGFDNTPTSDLSAISIVKGVHNMRINDGDDDEVKVEDVSAGTETDPQPDLAAQAQPASGGKKTPTPEQRAAKNKADRDRRAAKKQAASGGEQQARPAEGEAMATSTAKKARKNAAPKKERKVAAPKKERKVAAKKAGASGNGHAGPRGEKMKGIGHLLQRKTGCTAKDVLSLTGWPAVSMPAMAKACNLKLKKEKVEGKEGVRSHTRYFGTPA